MTFLKTIFRIAQITVAIALSARVLIAAAETAAPPAPTDSLPDLSADLQTTLIDRNGHASLSTVHIQRSGQSVRYEHAQIDPPEVWIMDFKQMKEYRIYAGDKMYFETAISGRLAFKAQREGLIPPEKYPDIVEARIVLGQDTIEGHLCDLVLLIRSIKDKKEFGSDYTFQWEARDLNRQRLRVAYYQDNSTLAVVNLRAVQAKPVDPALLQPPEGFASVSPY